MSASASVLATPLRFVERRWKLARIKLAENLRMAGESAMTERERAAERLRLASSGSKLDQQERNGPPGTMILRAIFRTITIHSAPLLLPTGRRQTVCWWEILFTATQLESQP